MSHRGQLQCLNNAVSYHSHTLTPSSSHSPVTKMTQPQRTASQDSTSDGIRKRVCKACDRCRLKKSKCDGSSPCSRCKADNAICVFGERKKSHDKVYPKGYVEMLEQQQGQLVSGLQECYKRLHQAGAWDGEKLSETNGYPLTHDILAALGLLETKQDGSGEMETFEDDCEKLQSRLIADGAGFAQRRGSFSSDSDHSQQGHGRSASRSTPALSKPPTFPNNFNFNFSAPPSPPASQGSPIPAPRQRPSFPQPQSSPLQQSSPLTNDPQFYQAEWAYPESRNAELLMNSKYAVQSPDLDQGLGNMGDMTSFNQWDASFDMKYDMNLAAGMTSYPQQLQHAFPGMSRMQDTNMAGLAMDPANLMEVDFNQYIQVHS
ncbi:fungal Zn binuclear cluster domain-containing [Lecanosticta acicola]|uniref:Fungal Zn binuclear cluster domain-containing n=1 Tax=Lecanosticta acicola TaxID=111012 RepID=A0AAI8YX03_9PEZI|nr:fungal Zn binuclear cluster domain-containing [Lecanosticta acicola]